MKPGVMAAVIVVVLIAIGAFVYLGSEEDSTDTNTANTPTNTQTPTQSATETQATAQEEQATEEMMTLTAEEVAKHNTSSDCWTIVDGEVYDITSYVPRHPGGDEILQACGADGSTLFNSRTTEDGETVGSGTSHSSNASNQLSGFRLGTLAN